MEKDWLLWGLSVLTVMSAPLWAYDRFVFSRKKVVLGSTPWLLVRVAPWFPLALLLIIIKLFFIEPFQVPSASMRPILSPGSVVLSTKWDYRQTSLFRLSPWAEVFKPARGEVVLFRYPKDLTSFFVKRVIGLPGDTVRVALDGTLSINNQQIKRHLKKECEDVSEKSERPACFKSWTEKIDGKSWTVLDNGESFKTRWTRQSACARALNGDLICNVPKECYFMMGDNRQDSFDSRDWGCVPRNLLEGRARVEFSFSSITASGWIH